MFARRFLIDVLSKNVAPEIVADAVLLVTELVTNAVMHVGTPAAVSVAIEADAITVTVTDQGDGPLLARPLADLAESGRGLWMVHRTASAWGTRHDGDGTSVWFRLERHSGGAPPPERYESADPNAFPVQRASFGAADGDRSAAWAAVEWLLGGTDEAGTLPVAALQEQLARIVDAAGADAAVLIAPGAFDGDDVLALGLPSGPALALQRQRPDDATVRDLLHANGMGDVLTVDLPGHDDAALHLGWRQTAEPDVARVLARVAAGRLALLLRLHRLEEADRRSRGFAAMLAEASDLLSASLDPALTAALVPTLVVPRLARWAAVHLVGDDGTFALAAVSHVDEDAAPELRERLAAGDVLAVNGSADLHGLGHVVAVPLTARRRQLGQLTLGLESSRALRYDGHAVVEDLARRAALALDNARTHHDQRELAKALQAALLPPGLPTDPAVEFGAQYVAAGTGAVVGGDFYDVIPLPTGGYGVVIGDVQGKGPTAAAVTGVAREIVRLLLRQSLPLTDVLAQLNDVLLDHEPQHFCTLVLARLVNQQLSLCVAGHPSPVLVRLGQAPEFVGGPGTLLGVMEDVALEEVTLTLAPGDALLMYTDGLTERRNGRRWLGERGVLELAAACRDHSAASMARTLLQGAVDFTAAPLRDDLAVLAVRVIGE